MRRTRCLGWGGRDRDRRRASGLVGRRKQKVFVRLCTLQDSETLDFQVVFLLDGVVQGVTKIRVGVERRTVGSGAHAFCGVTLGRCPQVRTIQIDAELQADVVPLWVTCHDLHNAHSAGEPRSPASPYQTIRHQPLPHDHRPLRCKCGSYTCMQYSLANV